jgi:Holliday junction DNA helicase RuvA
MIGRLRGIVAESGADWVILDVGGVGYLVHCAARTLARLPPAGHEATLAIETYVREDQIRLFGFESGADREWFRLLQTVQGVGAKVALAVLGVLGAGELAGAVALQDRRASAQAPGVGPKVAARIIAELKDRVPAFAADPAHVALAGALAADAAPQPAADAVSALVNLGYRRAEAYGAVAKAARDLGERASLDALIRAGLKELSQ